MEQNTELDSYSPPSLSMLFDQAQCFFESKRYDYAQKLYEQVLSLDPDNVRALHALGVIAYHRNDLEHAVETLLRVLRRKPDYGDAYCSLSKIQRSMGRLVAAFHSCQKAIETDSSSVEFHCVMGALCTELNQYDLSRKHLETALRLNPESYVAWYELAKLVNKLKRYDEALQYLTRSLELKLDYVDAYALMALVLVSQGRAPEANDCIKKCLKLRPDSTTVKSIQAFAINYIPGTQPSDFYSASIEWGGRAKQAIEQQSGRFCNTPDPERRLRLGFVSPDFRRHPVGYFVQSFFMLHDSEHYEIVCYSDVNTEDDLTESLIESSDKWRRISGISDQKLFEIIQRDGIDILVDLAGHTNNNRLLLFAMKPAPIQATWAGYVGTTGLDAIDYLISDNYQSPDGADEYTVERIVRLPADYICYTPPDFAPDVSPLPALKNGFITFGCFNNLAKISNRSITLWCAVLRQVDGSKLLIKNFSFNDEGTLKRILLLFEEQGISADRIMTEGQSPPQDMLACYAKVDIQLDTIPYSGGLTTLESLWMGVPVVTLPGLLFSSRHSLTHLMNVGLPECVATSEEEYISIACRLAADTNRLSELRMGLRQKMGASAVCDGFRFTDNLQNAFRKMWVEWCALAELGECIEKGVAPTQVSQNDCISGDHIDCVDQGNRYSDQGNFDAAIKCYRKALDLRPGYAEAYYNMGLVFYKAADFFEAERQLNLALCFSPDFVEAYVNLSNLLLHCGRFSDALIACKNAIDFVPDNPEIYNNLGSAFLNLGRLNDAQAVFEKALELKPDYHQAHSNLLYLLHFLPGTSCIDLYEMSRMWDNTHGCGHDKIYSSFGKTDSGRLRIGFVSPDFRMHPVGYFIQAFMMLHDRSRFEVICFSDVNHEDSFTELFRECSEEFYDVRHMDDNVLAEHVFNRGVDILVDLVGHTSGNRLKVFAMRVAPIQVTWAGYVGTTGLSAMDYLISDRFQSLEGAEAYTCESIVRMPNGYVSYSPPDYAPDITSLPARENGYVTFASFNKVMKISSEAVAMWAGVLQRVNGSRLLLKNNSFSDAAAVEYCLNLFAEHDIERDRLIVEGPSLHLDMLKAYAKVDIQLDTFPYNGGLTTLESIWMGVPVITLPGNLFSSRHSLSHLMNMALEECVATSREDYVERAVSLARDLDRLECLRSRLRDAMASSPVCNGFQFTDNLQDAFQSMWKRHDSMRRDGKKTTNMQSETMELYNRGIDLMDTGKLAEAEQLFSIVLQRMPEFISAANNKAIVCSRLGKHDAGIMLLKGVIDNVETFCEAHNNLGKIYLDIGDYVDALDCFDCALNCNPAFSEAMSNKGDALLALGLFDEAENAYCNAIKLSPARAFPYLKLGNMHLSKGRITEAKKSYQASLDINESAAAYSNLGNALMAAGDVEAALDCFEKAIRCERCNAAVYSNKLLSMNYLSRFSQNDILNVSRMWREHSEGINNFHCRAEVSFSEKPRIRVGYVSGDFRNHSVHYFIKPVLLNHDRKKFEVFCYSNVAKADAVTHELSEYVDNWVTITPLSDADVAQRIRRDAIDVLVDLAGHTAGNRLGVFCRRPAPVQASWIGYPNTTGLQEIDYRITDGIADPAGVEDGYTESLYRLEGGFLCYAPPDSVPEIVSPPSMRRHGAITFGSFNTTAKLSKETITCWARLMREIPNARMILKSVYFVDDNVCSRITDFFTSLGVKKERLQLFPFTDSVVDHLKLYNQVDIALDPFPYNGTTTTFEALLMGVPVVTLSGNRHASRVGNSILSNLGLSMLVAISEDEYVKIAHELSKDTEKLCYLRFYLRERLLRSSWCNDLQFIDKLEDAYCKMIEVSGTKNQHIDKMRIHENKE